MSILEGVCPDWGELFFLMLDVHSKLLENELITTGLLRLLLLT